MVYVDGAFHFSILVYHLVVIWDAADVVRPFPPRRQLGSAFRRGGESKDETADLVRVSSWGSRRSSHLLVSKLKLLLYSVDVCGGVLSGRGRIGIQVEVGRKRWLAACCNHGGRESMRFVRHCVEGQRDPCHFVNPCLGRRSFEQASAEHVVEGPMAPSIKGGGVVYGDSFCKRV